MKLGIIKESYGILVYDMDTMDGIDLFPKGKEGSERFLQFLRDKLELDKKEEDTDE